MLVLLGAHHPLWQYFLLPDKVLQFSIDLRATLAAPSTHTFLNIANGSSPTLELKCLPGLGQGIYTPWLQGPVGSKIQIRKSRAV